MNRDHVSDWWPIDKVRSFVEGLFTRKDGTTPNLRLSELDVGASFWVENEIS